MSESHPKNHDDVLARLTEAFVEQSVPDGPDEAVKQRLLVSLGQAAASSPTVVPPRIWKGPLMRKVVSVAAILLVVVGVAAYMNPPSGKGSGSAFAAMVNRVQESRTARFRMAVKMKGQPEGSMDAVMTSMDPSWLRTEMSMGGVQVTSITNFQDGRSLLLFPDSKKGQFRDRKNGGATGNRNWIDALRNLKSDDATYIGEEIVDGMATAKYVSQKKGDFYTVWINTETDLPIRVVFGNKEDSADADIQVMMSAFEWDVTVDESEFTLELPAGYELTNVFGEPNEGSEGGDR